MRQSNVSFCMLLWLNCLVCQLKPRIYLLLVEVEEQACCFEGLNLNPLQTLL